MELWRFVWHFHRTWSFLHILLMFGFCLAVVDEDEDVLCLPLCTCSDAVINCTNAGLSHLPRFPIRVAKIVMDHNEISFIAENSLKGLRKLEFLSIKHNNISSIHENAFAHLESLHTLILDDNWLQELPGNVFANNIQLTKLSLMGNEFSFKALNATLSNTHMLTDVNIEDNFLSDDMKIPEGFGRMNQLQYLELGANDGIKNITEDYFEAIAQLPVLYLGLGYCPIQQVHPSAFLPLTNIEQLDMSYTNLKGSELKNAFSGLQNSSVNVIHLSYVFVYPDAHLSSDIFDPLMNSEVHVLNLEGNYAGLKGFLHNHFFRPLRHLRELYLDNCQLHNVYRDAFKGLSKLKTLSLSHNLISCLSDCDFLSSGPKLRGLLLLDLSHNVISGGSQLRLHVDVFPKLHTLLLNYNRITSLHRNMFVEMDSLAGIDLSDNPITSIEAGSFQDLHGLNSLYIQGSHHLKELPNGTFRGLKALARLLLNRNAIETVHSKAFHGLRHLQRLELNGNRLQSDRLNLPADSKTLQLLDLGNNLLEEFPSDVAEFFPNLKQLLLPYNRIYSVGHDTLIQLRHLDTLDFSYNEITVVPKGAFVDMLSLRSLNFAGNPFSCTCELKDFVDWLRGSQYHKLTNHEHRCLSPSRLRGTTLSSYTPSVWECSVKAVILPLLSVLGLITIVIVICIMYSKVNTTRPEITIEETPPTTSNRSKSHRPGNCTWIRELLPMSNDTSPSSDDDTNPEEPLICESPVSDEGNECNEEIDILP